MSPRNEPVIAAQRVMLGELLRRYLQPGQPYCLLDFPDHSNVGDSAIYLGELRLLDEEVRRRADYVCTLGSYNPARLEAACPEGPILIHGGGNFGDIWPAHQRFRERILGDFPDRRVIQLPQSIHFQDQANADICARAIESHGDFHLWVRDAKSAAFAREHFNCAIEISPDSAFALGPIARRAAPTVDTLLLLRTDSEQRDYRAAALNRPGRRVVDWLDEAPFGIGWRGVVQLKGLLAGDISREQRDEFKFRELATARVERGLRLLSEGRGLVTDRLHAHILATLLDIPHVALDNTYGKIASYTAAWTAGYPAVKLAVGLEEALVLINALQLELEAN